MKTDYVTDSIGSVAIMCGVHYQTVYNWVRNGLLVACRCTYSGYGPKHWEILICQSNVEFLEQRGYL